MSTPQVNFSQTLCKHTEKPCHEEKCDECPFKDPPQITYWPPVGWQLCPMCNGNGTVFNMVSDFTMNTSAVCPVCYGQRIISTATGKPPINI